MFHQQELTDINYAYEFFIKMSEDDRRTKFTYLKNYKVDGLTVTSANGNAKYVTLVKDENEYHVLELSPKIRLALEVYSKGGKPKSFTLIRFNDKEILQEFSINSFSLDLIRQFNELISTLDLDRITSHKLYTLPEKVDQKSALQILEKYKDDIQNNHDFNKDIVAIAHKREVLKTFKTMLAKDCDEKDWQSFFEENEWIFGYGLQYRINKIIRRECQLSPPGINGTNAVINDFAIGDEKFLTFIELKKPNTPIFSNKNRSNCWGLSPELLNAFSQILEHKASGPIQFKNSGINCDNDGNKIRQIALDPKVILIIGTWDEIKNDSDQVKEIKARTFELFRRDSRNVEIFTFDELLNRAKFIVEHLR